ncbi:lasso peptide biosynthesis B2 protein [Streptomyces oryzae]|uniref:lasso peptide biosynthesis B2 protein n=1 Tax=Streptomyces oryzae TaxID=1434886 RepID=UPI0027DAD3CB|nr:lasso peptide biosynthesis B2 protein [Streptomyces oryzae]
MGERAVRLAPHRQLEARAAVGVARLLVKLKPGRLRRVLTVLSRGARPAGRERALYARQAAVSVSARCAGLGCLQRTVAAALLCRLHGEWPDWCSGFRTRPFGAHAWIEADGEPVGEGEAIDAFRTMIAVRARPARGTKPPRAGKPPLRTRESPRAGIPPRTGESPRAGKPPRAARTSRTPKGARHGHD